MLIQIQRLLMNYKENLNIKFYLERGYALMMQKTQISQSQEEITQKINMYKKRANAIERSLKKLKLHDISSQLSSVKSDTSHCYSVSSVFSENDKEDSKVEESDLQRYFFSLCLREKLNYKSSHPAQKVSIPALFQEAKNITPEQWKTFIAHELKNPQKWLRNSSRPRRANFNFFEAIPEEL